MSVFKNNVYAKELTDVVGIGCTVNPDGSILLVTGINWGRVTADPNAVVTANAGSLRSQTNGTLWINTNSATTWVSLGGGGSGWNLPDDVIGAWGTAATNQFQSVYVSASRRFDLRGEAQIGTLGSVAARFATGTSTASTAVVGGGSGLIEILTGATDATDVGGTGGPSGALTFSTGNASSTAGSASGSTGTISFTTGNSTDANSGNVVIGTGTAAGVRGVLDLNVVTIDATTQAQQWLMIDNTIGALNIGSTGALTSFSFDSTNGAEGLLVNAASGIRFADDKPTSWGTSTLTGIQASYVSGSNWLAIAGPALTSINAAGATKGIRVITGDRTVTDALGQPSSGPLYLITGNTDCTNGGGTGGITGTISIGTGNALSTAGTSGPSGPVQITTGGSDDGLTGAINLTTGTVSSLLGGGIASGAITLRSGGVSGVATTGDVTLRSGDAAGAGVSGNIVLQVGTTAGGIAGAIDVNAGAVDFVTQDTMFILKAASANALKIGSAAASDMITVDTATVLVGYKAQITTTNGVTSGTPLAVGGRASSTTADSATLAGSATATQTFNQSITINANTLTAGRTVRIWGCVKSTGLNGADLKTVIVRVGGATYLTGSATPAVNGDRLYFQLRLTARAAPGAAVAVAGVGMSQWSTAGAVSVPGGAIPNQATNGPLAIDVQITMVNNAGNTAVLEQLVADFV
jgi:hypothetical protein